MFVATNIDDMVMLAVFFGRAATSRADTARVIGGQYLGFVAILAASVLGAMGAGLLPKSAVPYLGLVPLLLGLWTAWKLWRDRNADDADDADPTGRPGVGVLQVAMVTFANGGDNIGVYVPAFAVAGVGAMSAYVVVFLIGVAVWCVAGRALARHRAVAPLLVRWGHIVVPVALIGIGLAILVEGGAFGL